MTAWRLEQTLFWKELRSLWVFAGAFLVLELSLVLLVWRGVVVAELFSNAVLQALSFVLWGALLGLVSFGSEREAGTWTLLRGLALSPASMLVSKVGAALLVLAVVLVARFLVSVALGLPAWTTPSPVVSVIVVLAVVIAWGLGAWWTTTRPGIALASSLLLFVPASVAWSVWGAAPGWLVVELAALVVLFRQLGRWLVFGPSRVDHQGEARREGARPRRVAGRGWPLVLFWRIDGPAMGWALAIPWLLLALPFVRSSPALVFLPVPLLAAWLGAGVVSRDEHSSADLFLHHLPFPRRRWLLPRLLSGLALGLGLIAMSVLAILLCQSLDLVGLQWQHESIVPTMVPAFLAIYAFTYLVAAALASWLEQRAVVAVLALVTLAQLTALGLPSMDSLRCNASALALLGAVAWWSLMHSPAFEPGRGKARRALWVVGLVWAALSLLVALLP